MLSLLFGFLFFSGIAWAWHRWPWAMVACFFLIFTFGLRTICATYIDLFGPLFATELQFDVGPGTSTPLFVLCVALVFVCIVAFQAKIQVDVSKLRCVHFGLNPRLISNVAFGILAAWVLAGFVEMLGSGHIPLLEGMDRIEFQEDFSGPIYRLSYSLGFLFAVATGFFFVYGQLQFGRYDYRFAAVLGAQLFLFVLTGNRFSIFYLELSYFMIPLASILLLRARGTLVSGPAEQSPIHRFLTGRYTRGIALFAGIAILASILVNNVFNVRYSDDTGQAQEALLQRSLVQPIELYSVTWDRLVNGELGDTSLAWDLMFNNPIDATRNTGIQYLMATSLGEGRTTEIIEANSQFAGGYPEVLIELFGIRLSALAMLAVALVVGFLYRLLCLSAIYGRILTFLFSGYVLFAFNLLYIGGMLNFFLPVTFWLKVAGLGVAIIVEPYLMGKPQPNRTSPAAPA